MAETSSIEWTDATWNPITGCSVISPGCAHCYAMKLAGTRMKSHPSRAGLTRDTKAGPVWTGEVRFNEGWLVQPLQWKRPRKIFVCAHADLFHENVPDEWIDRIFAVMALCPQHIFQVLTKRADRMREYLSRPHELALRVQDVVDTREPDGIWKFPDHEPWAANKFPLRNVWLGVSVEDQKRADERIPHLLATPAAVRWLSMEPLLGPVDLRRLKAPGCTWLNALNGSVHAGSAVYHRDEHVDWVVLGGESGPGARPMHPDWARSVRDQCAEAGVPFHFKQHGDWLLFDHLEPGQLALRDYESRLIDEGTSGPFYRVGKKAAGRLLDGVEHNGMPA